MASQFIYCSRKMSPTQVLSRDLSICLGSFYRYSQQTFLQESRLQDNMEEGDV